MTYQCCVLFFNFLLAISFAVAFHFACFECFGSTFFIIRIQYCKCNCALAHMCLWLIAIEIRVGFHCVPGHFVCAHHTHWTNANRGKTPTILTAVKYWNLISHLIDTHQNKGIVLLFSYDLSSTERLPGEHNGKLLGKLLERWIVIVSLWYRATSTKLVK